MKIQVSKRNFVRNTHLIWTVAYVEGKNDMEYETVIQLMNEDVHM